MGIDAWLPREVSVVEGSQWGQASKCLLWVSIAGKPIGIQ